MSTDVFKLKSAVRARVRAALKTMMPAARMQSSVAACRLLKEQPVWQEATSVLFYTPLPDELDVLLLWQEAMAQKKLVALPRFDSEANAYAARGVEDLAESLVEGKFGVLEPAPNCPPVSLNQLDLILVPGVAFDWSGRRLGRGRGFYDRLLRDVSGTKCGVAFDQQIEEQIPVEPHDVLLDCILTPTRWLRPTETRP